MTPQVHHPHHFYLAWTLALMATGKNTGTKTLDSTVWIEATPEATVFHSSNKASYLRTTIPTLDGDGSAWRHIVHDPYRQARDIANKSKAANPDQQETMARYVNLTPTEAGDQVSIEMFDPVERTSMATAVPVHDLEWPFDVIAQFDRHVGDAQFSLGITPQFARLFAGVTKLLNTTIPIAPDTVKAAFDVEHPQIPEIRIQGVSATKTP